MAKRGRSPLGSVQGSIDDGYPVPRTVDGIDTERIADRSGYRRQFAARINQHTDWANSRTGEKMDAPDYARDNDID